MLDRDTKKIFTTLLSSKGVDRRTIVAALQVAEGTQLENIDRVALMVTQAEAARLISVSRFTIRKLVKDGKLRRVELLPGLYRFRVDELLDL